MSQPEIGGWEKHTKGIGLKLLQKFGFKGRLGANEDGISAAVSVVVRPTNVGLGFGDTVEAPNLPENKKIEAEWKGVEYVEPVTVKVSQSNWKKVDYNKRKVKKREVTLEDDLDVFGIRDVSSSIIDMRYADHNIQTFDSSKVLFGEELLHNVQLISQLQRTAINSEVKSINLLKKRQNDLNTQLSQKNAKLMIDLQRIDTLTTIKNKLQVKCDTFDSVCDLLKSIYVQYPVEFELFGLVDLIPHYLTTAIKEQQWNSNTSMYFMNLVVSMTTLISFFDNQNNDSLTKTVSILTSKCCEVEFLPFIRRFITNDLTFNSTSDFIMLLKNLQYVLNGEAFDQLIDSALLPKLMVLTETHSSSSSGTHVLSYLVPWIPLLKDKMRPMMSTIKRLLIKRINNWEPIADMKLHEEMFVWKTVMDVVTFEKIIVEFMVPKLLSVLLIRSGDRQIQPTDSEVVILFNWIELIPVTYLDCLLLCGLCPQWLHSLYNLLSRAADSQDLIAVNDWYLHWKQFFAVYRLESNSIQTMLNVTLTMIRSAIDSWHSFDIPYSLKVSKFQYIIDSYDSLKYEEWIEIKLIEQKILYKIEHNTTETESLKSRYVSTGNNASIKDVLETLALKYGIEFAPKHGKVAYGRPVWLFGTSQIYFDGNVVYVYRTTNTFQVGMSPWIPVSFDELVETNKQS